MADVEGVAAAVRVELGEGVAEDEPDPAELRRFLVACGGVEPKAAHVYAKSRRWREAERVGALEPGEVVQVLETRELRQEGVAPMLRLRTARGWVSTATGKGAEVVLEPTGFVGGARWWWPTADAGQ